MPWIEPVALRRRHRRYAECKHQLTRFIALVSAIREQRQQARYRSKRPEQVAALGCFMRFTGREGKRYRRSSIRSNPMNLGVPTSMRLADGLRVVFQARR